MDASSDRLIDASRRHQQEASQNLMSAENAQGMARDRATRHSLGCGGANANDFDFI